MGDNELKVAVEEPRTWARRLTITVPAARIDRERDGVARKLAQRLKLPGFRKGRVPAHVLQKKYGAAIERETLEHVVGEAYREAIRQQNLQPITQASIDAVDWQPGSDLTFQAEFEVRPEIELNRLGGFRIEAPRPTVQEEEVDRLLESIRADQAEYHPLETGTPSLGDRVSIEITPLTEGEEAKRSRQYELVLGEGQAVPDVEAAIRTLSPGGEGEFDIRIAPGSAEAEAGAEQKVHLRLLAAQHPELPALDDELARRVGDFADVGELRARVRQDMEKEAGREVEREVRRRLLQAVIEANPFEVPDAMIDQYLDSVLQGQPGLDPTRVDELRENTRPAAEQALKRLLVVDRIAKLEGLEASAADVDERVQALAARLGRPAEEIRTQLRKGGRLTAIAEEIMEDKVFEYLKSMSTIE
jgi:trigger factor